MPYLTIREAAICASPTGFPMSPLIEVTQKVLLASSWLLSPLFLKCLSLLRKFLCLLSLNSKYYDPIISPSPVPVAFVSASWIDSAVHQVPCSASHGHPLPLVPS